MEHKTSPPPHNHQKDKDFSGDGRLDGSNPRPQLQPQLQPDNLDPHYQIQTPTSEKIMLWGRGREQCPRDLGLWPPSLLLYIHSYQRPHLSPRMICQTIDQLQFIRAPHGLVQAKCQGTCLNIGTGYSCQTI